MHRVIERLLNLLAYLLSETRPVTADEIRRTVAGYGDQSDDAFHRMFERDKVVLRRIGIPLELRPLDAFEVDFGYVVDASRYAAPDPGLADEERAALALAARVVRVGEGAPGAEGIYKLGGADLATGVEPLGADLGAEAELLASLFEAVADKRKVEFAYSGKDRRLAPYGLGHRRGHWYVVGESGEGIRVFRTDRISGLELDSRAGSFQRPADFQIRSAFGGQPWDVGEDNVEATVEFDAEVAWWAARALRTPYDESGGEALVVTIPVSNRDSFVGWILSFGASAEVKSPPGLRAEIVDKVEAALATLP